jgi:hypothetical protein
MKTVSSLKKRDECSSRRTFWIHIQGWRPCPPLRKREVLPKRRHTSTTHVVTHRIIPNSKSPHLITNSPQYVTYISCAICKPELDFPSPTKNLLKSYALSVPPTQIFLPVTSDVNQSLSWHVFCAVKK